MNPNKRNQFGTSKETDAAEESFYLHATVSNPEPLHQNIDTQICMS